MTAQTQPGERVYRTRKGAELLLRSCRGLAEFEACVDLQRVIWGYPDLEISPRKAFLLAQQLGGQVMGAYDGQARLVGFVMAMAALEAAGPGEPPRPYLHSNMLAVLPEYRDQGLGTRLKLMQREDALSRGILRMTWTFDPLAAKNAYLNLHRLGAIARRYSPDFYGVSSSRLQGGLPTDRLHAEWWLQSPRVQACVGAITGQQQEPLQQPVQAVAVPDPHPQRESMPVEDASVQQTIVLPRELEQWKQDVAAFAKVKAIQDGNRTLFLNAFANGLAVTDFRMDASGSGVFELASLRSEPGITPNHHP